MIRNYLNVALRNLLRQRSHSMINITGLSVGIAACLVIMLYVRYELSFESTQQDADRTYRIDMSWYIFVLAAAITVFVALCTVSYQSIKAALSNPIKALRYE